MRIVPNLAIPAAALALIFAGGCSHQTISANNNPEARIDPAPDPGVVELPQTDGFPLARVSARQVPNRLTLNCAAQPDVTRSVHVTSLSGGRVVELRARLGDVVQRGQVLVVIRSSDLATAISEYEKFQADAVLAERSLERVQLLYSRGAVARKEVDQAEDMEHKARVDLETAAERIRILGGDIEHPSPVLEVRSPISGVVVEQNTTGGESVKSIDNAPSLFTVADLSWIWMMCDVYENDLAQVHLGDFTTVRLNAYPDRPLSGRLSNISGVLDPATRTAKVRIELDNRHGLMRPGMFATANFVCQRTEARMVVPTSAILRLHDKDWVFRKEGERRFRRTEVQAGPTLAGNEQEILGGLRPGDEVAANALELSSAAQM